MWWPENQYARIEMARGLMLCQMRILALAMKPQHLSTRCSSWLLAAMLSAAFLRAPAQNCSSPVLLCGGSTSAAGNTSTGFEQSTPASFCFSDAIQSLYFTFETLDLQQFPDIDYSDASANLDLSGLVCTADTTTASALDIAVFEASDPCDAATMNAPVFCTTMVTADTVIALANLQPSTTYYVLISGAMAQNPSACTFNLAIDGPAVTYDLQANFRVLAADGSTRVFVLEGETVTLGANEALDGYTWQGQYLNATDGNPVTATPEGVNENFTYTVQTDINGCTYTDQVSFIVQPSIFPYNAFTPNADGFNDAWEIRNIAEWPDAQITVYSRWGQKVFQATNYGNDWMGDQLPEATYYYHIDLQPGASRSLIYTGAVTILR